MEDLRSSRNNNTSISPSSSPPTPPSPLPISVGPGNRRYSFSPSPSPSPPFSPHNSDEKLPFLPEKTPLPQLLSAFSLDQSRPVDLDSNTSSCLQDLVEWFIQKCCNCCCKSP